MEYQGIAIISDPDEGPCITFYGPGDRQDYDLDVAKGMQPDGRKILHHRWLLKPTEDIQVSRRFWDHAMNPGLE